MHKNSAIYRPTTERKAEVEPKTVCLVRMLFVVAVIIGTVSSAVLCTAVWYTSKMCSCHLPGGRTKDDHWAGNVPPRDVDPLANTQHSAQGLLQQDGSVLWNTDRTDNGGAVKVSDRVQNDTGGDDILYLLLGTHDGDNLHSNKGSKGILPVHSGSGRGTTGAVGLLICFAAIGFLHPSYYPIIFALMASVPTSGQYMNPAPTLTNANGDLMKCTIQGKSVLTDLAHWRYMGRDSCLSRWNTLMCTQNTTEAIRAITCGNDVSSEFPLCTRLRTLGYCASLIRAIHALVPPSCPRFKEIIRTDMSPGWINSNTLDLPSEWDGIAMGGVIRRMRDISPDGDCLMSNQEGSGFQLSVGGDDIDELINMMAIVEAMPPTEAINTTSTLWVPGKPIECFQNITTPRGIRLTGLVNECPTNLTATTCNGTCWLLIDNTERYQRQTPAGDCCIQRRNVFSEVKTKELCSKEAEKVILMDPRTCGSKKYYLYGCDNDCFEDKFGVWVAAATPKLTDKSSVMVADCDKLKKFDFKYNQSVVRGYRDDCSCVEDELCFKENGLIKKIGLDFATERDRVEGVRCMKIHVESYIDLTSNTRQDNSPSNFILTEFGVRSTFMTLEYGSVCKEVLIKNNPILLDTTGSDLRKSAMTRAVGGGELIVPDRDDTPIVTSRGTTFIDKCLAEMVDGTLASYDQRVVCIKGVEDENRTNKLKLTIIASAVVIILYLLYVFLLNRSLSQTSNVTLMLWPTFKLWQIAACTDSKEVKLAVDMVFSKDKLTGKFKHMSVASIEVMAGVVCKNSKVVYYVTWMTIWCPMLLTITIPISFLVGLLSILCSIPNWIRGFDKCEDDRGRKWCFFTATSYIDLLSKFMILHMIHCPLNCMKDGITFKTSVFKSTIILLFVVALMYAYAVDLIILPSVTAGSIGHSVNLAGKCDGVVCQSVVDFDVDIKIAVGNFIEYPLMDNGKNIGKITVIHSGMTRKFTGTYKHSQPQFSERITRAVCKSVDGYLYDDTMSCWKYWDAGPLDKDETCGGSYGGGNRRMGSDWEYNNIPMFCNFYTPKGFNWGLSVADDGHEFIGIAYTQNPHAPVIRQYAMNEGILYGTIRIKVEIAGEITFDEEVSSDALFDTTRFELYDTQVTLKESFGSSKSLAGDSVSCFFINSYVENPEFCTLRASNFGDRSVLRVYGEHSDTQGCGVLDYTDWQLNRASFQGTYGSDIQNMMRTIPMREDLQRDSESIVSTTSCAFRATTSGAMTKFTEPKCTNRNWKDQATCHQKGNMWTDVTTCLPPELEIMLTDCSIAAINVRYTSSVSFSIDAGTTTVVNPATVKMDAKGCFGISNRLMITFTTDGSDTGVLRISKDKGVDCSAMAYVRSGRASINCTAYYSSNITIGLVASDGSVKVVPIPVIEKCKSYSFDSANVGNVNPESTQATNDWLLIVIVAGVMFFTILCLLILIVLCLKICLSSGSNTTVRIEKQERVSAEAFTTDLLIKRSKELKGDSYDSTRKRKVNFSEV
jgi:hypothetical protein